MNVSPGRHQLLAWAGIWLVVAIAVVLPYAHTYRHLSPFDEMVHVDYVVKLQDGHLVRAGDKVGTVAMREQACRRSDVAQVPIPRCGARLDADRFPGEGFNTSYNDPPAYYAVTAVGAWLVDALPGVSGIVTAARALGVLWLAGGLLATFQLALALGANRVASAGVTLAVGATPAVALSSSTVTSDAPELLVGAVLGLLAVGLVRGRLSWWWLGVGAAVAAAVKVTSLTALGLVVVFLLLSLRGRSPTERRPIALGLGATLLGGGVVSLGWTLLVHLRALPAAAGGLPTEQMFRIHGLTWNGQIVPNLYVLLSPIQNAYLPPFLNDGTLVVLLLALHLLVVAGTAALAWYGRPAQEASRFAGATLLAMVVSGPAFVLLVYAGSHTYFPIPPRYGAALIGPAAACLAVAGSRRRAGGYTLVALGLLGSVALLAQTL